MKLLTPILPLLPLLALRVTAFLRVRSTERDAQALEESRLHRGESATELRAWVTSIKESVDRGGFAPLTFNLDEKGSGNMRPVAAGDAFVHVGGSTFGVATLLIQDPDAPWGQEAMYPAWAPKVLATTRNHARRHNHTYLLRRRVTHPFPYYMIEGPRNKSFRIEANWEKFTMVLDYLETGRFSHLLVLDADATIFHPDHDTLRTMSAAMDKRGADLVVADEDWWGKPGPEHANGGVQLWKNTTYSKELLRALIAAHQDPEKTRWLCWNNEQLCLQGFLQDKKGIKRFPLDDGRDNRFHHIWGSSGMKYNRHICSLPAVWGGGDGKCKNGFMADTSVDPEIVHFMGGGKPNVDRNPIFDIMLTDGIMPVPAGPAK